MTETGQESASHGIQVCPPIIVIEPRLSLYPPLLPCLSHVSDPKVFGGHGYIKENGMEQIFRDARISTLYEGTTGVQALDLLGRKVCLARWFWV